MEKSFLALNGLFWPKSSHFGLYLQNHTSDFHVTWSETRDSCSELNLVSEKSKLALFSQNQDYFASIFKTMHQTLKTLVLVLVLCLGKFKLGPFWPKIANDEIW